MTASSQVKITKTQINFHMLEKYRRLLLKKKQMINPILLNQAFLVNESDLRKTGCVTSILVSFW